MRLHPEPFAIHIVIRTKRRVGDNQLQVLTEMLLERFAPRLRNRFDSLMYRKRAQEKYSNWPSMGYRRSLGGLSDAFSEERATTRHLMGQGTSNTEIKRTAITTSQKTTVTLISRNGRTPKVFAQIALGIG